MILASGYSSCAIVAVVPSSSTPTISMRLGRQADEHAGAAAGLERSAARNAEPPATSHIAAAILGWV